MSWLHEVRIKDICDLITVKTNIKNASIENYISTENMLPNFGGVEYAEKIPASNTVNTFIPQDVLFSNIRTYFKKVWFSRFNGTASADVLVFRAKDNCDSKFLYYLMCDPSFIEYTVLTSKGAKMPRGDKDAIFSYPVLLPSLKEQKTMTSMLSSLDDKIDLLHRQNKTLESMAETLFRQWFIEEAQDEWIYEELGSVIDTSSGGTPSRKEMSFYQNGIYNWVKSKELNGSLLTKTEEMITDEAIKKSSAKLLPAYSTLIAMYGATVGEYALTTKEMACNQAVCALKYNKKYPYTFIFMYIKTKKNELINQAIGSAQQNISQIIIKKMLIPTCHDLIAEYHTQVEAYFDSIKLNIEKIQTLENLRDILLPKLMSGEVRVQYAEEAIASVA